MRRIWATVTAIGFVGCVAVAWLGLPEVAYIPPGCLTLFGIMGLLSIDPQDK